jgi:iron(III) transport system substrate-binding protein
MPRQAADDETNRRRFLGYTGAALFGTTALAGCSDENGGEGGNESGGGNGGESNGTQEQEPVEPEGEPITAEGVSWEELDPLEGELVIYSGRTEDQISPLLREIDDLYDDLTLETRYGDSAGMVGQIEEEGENSPADLFYTQDSGTLGALKEAGRTAPLTEDVIDTVTEEYRDPEGTWTGVSGRVRCVAYNADVWDEEELPDDIFEYADDERFENEMGWRVDSGSFLSFIRAMMIEYGEEETREWIEGLQGLGITNYEGGSTTPEAIANQEVSIGFVNHYYVGRLIEDQPDAPVGVTFTDGDIGSLFNVSGVSVVDSSDDPDLARNFTRHLLTTEGQEFFVETNAEYAVIPSVEYVGDLPDAEEVNPPQFDLNQLSDVEPAQDLLRETGVL